MRGDHVLSANSYIDDGINSGGGCVSAVTSRTRLGWVRFRE